MSAFVDASIEASRNLQTIRGLVPVIVFDRFSVSFCVFYYPMTELYSLKSNMGLQWTLPDFRICLRERKVIPNKVVQVFMWSWTCKAMNTLQSTKISCTSMNMDHDSRLYPDQRKGLLLNLRSPILCKGVLSGLRNCA